MGHEVQLLIDLSIEIAQLLADLSFSIKHVRPLVDVLANHFECSGGPAWHIVT